METNDEYEYANPKDIVPDGNYTLYAETDEPRCAMPYCNTCDDDGSLRVCMVCQNLRCQHTCSVFLLDKQYTCLICHKCHREYINGKGRATQAVKSPKQKADDLVTYVQNEMVFQTTTTGPSSLSLSLPDATTLSLVCKTGERIGVSGIMDKLLNTMNVSPILITKRTQQLEPYVTMTMDTFQDLLAYSNGTKP